MKIMIADNHQIVRIGLSSIINESYPHAIISEAGKASELYAHMQKQFYELILLDLKLPETDSLELLEQILKISPSSKVLIISNYPEKLYAIRYLKAGASGFLQKNESDLVIRNAIKIVLNNKTFLSMDMVDVMTYHIKNGTTADPFEKLSKREFEVALHIINGLTPGEIGEVMGLQSPTISIYKSRIFNKLNISRVHDLLQISSFYNNASLPIRSKRKRTVLLK